MNKHQVNKIFGFLLLAFCIIGVLLAVFREINLKKRYKIGICTTTAFTVGGRGNAGGIWIDYVFLLNGNEYKGSSRYLSNRITKDDLKNYILYKTFPVVYSPSNPSLSSILIIPKDFSRFGHPFPDSLKWVLLYFKMK